MKKLKVFFIVIVSILAFAVCLEGITYIIQSHRLIKEGYKFIGNTNRPPYPMHIEIFSNHYEKMNKCEFFQNKKGLNFKKNSILVFGDVFASSLEDRGENSLTAKLSLLTKRPVYNFASAGWGIPHMYFLLKNEEYISTIKNPDTILFVYNNDLKNRLTSFSFYPHHTFLNLKYKIDDGVLVEEIPKALFLYNSYFIRAMERANGFRISKSKNPQIQQQTFELIKSLFEESRRIAQTRYPQMQKFVILRGVDSFETLRELDKKENNAVAQLEYNMWQKLKNEGFIVIDITDLSDNDFTEEGFLSEDNSFSPQTLDKLLPELVKTAGL